MSQNNDQPHPPDPRTIAKKWQFYRMQWVGIPLILLIPVLALLGVFGESEQKVDVANNTFSVHINYPTRYRYKMINNIEVSLENISNQTMPTVTVSLNADYVNRFSTITFHPSLTSVKNGQYEVELTEVRTGETRLVTIELQGEAYFQHEGVVSVTAAAVPTLRVPIQTFIFP